MKKSAKKLSLGKMTVANLSVSAMNAVVGGATASVSCLIPSRSARPASVGCGVPAKTL